MAGQNHGDEREDAFEGRVRRGCSTQFHLSNVECCDGTRMAVISEDKRGLAVRRLRERAEKFQLILMAVSAAVATRRNSVVSKLVAEAGAPNNGKPPRKSFPC